MSVKRNITINPPYKKNNLWIIPIQDYIDSYMDYINTGLYP